MTPIDISIQICEPLYHYHPNNQKWSFFVCRRVCCLRMPQITITYKSIQYQAKSKIQNPVSIIENPVSISISSISSISRIQYQVSSFQSEAESNSSILMFPSIAYNSREAPQMSYDSPQYYSIVLYTLNLKSTL